ncbi:MAG: helix-turn-helix transcriptional regulator [Candidatus Heimdallarchaeota archaeon]|nr:MAG: helix-turn-helix transcriptional regulator [Candidatus Heimdallarchaeota archaeon]
MVSQNSEKKKSSQDKLDEILLSVTELRTHFDNLDHRISQLEGYIDRNLSISTRSSILKSAVENREQTDFDNLDDHLKRTYQTLAEAQEPEKGMTASEVAERMGRSRSTTSYHLNKLEKMGILEKFPSPSKESSRTVLFRPKDRPFELLDSHK